MIEHESGSQTDPLDGTPVRSAFGAGLVVIPCPAFVMTLDLDGSNVARMQRLRKVYSLHPKYSIVTVSKSGEGRHVYIDVRGMSEQIDVLTMMCEAIAAGSDPVRERLSYIRFEKRYPFPWKLFETPKEAERVITWSNKRGLGLRTLSKEEYDRAMDAYHMSNDFSLDDDMPF